ncbi:FUSC family protein [Streptococcus equinus]|uniref:FUSC family protein n=1 Tax=Streptococcus equinus TaxID=1335 RepID=UPI00051C88A7|nr:aromatic acid exporter family protein [Streptococcus equinus]
MRYLKNILSNYKFDPSKFKLGMRTLKTGLSVFLVLLIFHLFGWEGLQIGTLTAVFSLRESFDRSVHFGFSRIIGNSVGGFLSLLFFLINQLFHNQFWVTLVFVPIFTMLGIMINVSINNKSGIIGATAALLIITLSIPAGDTILYVFARVFETFCGVFVAILVNSDVDLLRKMLKK